MKTKITALILIFVCLFFACYSASADEILCGDVNSDGNVDMDDFYLVYNYLTGADTFDSISELDAADIDRNGSVDVRDAAELLHYINGILSELPYTHKGYARLVILSYPDKLEYIEGEELSLDGFVLAIEYSGGTVEETTNFTYSGYTSTPGVKIITVSCLDAKIAFVVTVYPK